jgi:hypothetical protein
MPYFVYSNKYHIIHGDTCLDVSHEQMCLNIWPNYVAEIYFVDSLAAGHVHGVLLCVCVVVRTCETGTGRVGGCVRCGAERARAKKRIVRVLIGVLCRVLATVGRVHSVVVCE